MRSLLLYIEADSVLSFSAEKLSLLRERRSVEYWMLRDYIMKTENNVPATERCTFVVTPRSFMVHGIAFAYPKDSDLGKFFDPL
jgi:chaperone required for assembly of F1-ATPase